MVRYSRARRRKMRMMTQIANSNRELRRQRREGLLQEDENGTDKGMDVEEDETVKLETPAHDVEEMSVDLSKLEAERNCLHNLTLEDKYEDREEAEDETPISVTQLDNASGVQVLQPSPRLMTKRCFSCNVHVYIKAKTKFNFSKSRYVFFLEELLEIPGKKSAEYLQVLDKPTEWIIFCEKCRFVIEEGMRVREKIAKLKLEVKTWRDVIVSRMKNKIGSGENVLKSVVAPKHVKEVLKAIRLHVTNGRKVIFRAPFIKIKGSSTSTSNKRTEGNLNNLIPKEMPTARTKVHQDNFSDIANRDSEQAQGEIKTELSDDESDPISEHEESEPINFLSGPGPLRPSTSAKPTSYKANGQNTNTLVATAASSVNSLSTVNVVSKLFRCSICKDSKLYKSKQVFLGHWKQMHSESNVSTFPHRTITLHAEPQLNSKVARRRKQQFPGQKGITFLNKSNKTNESTIEEIQLSNEAIHLDNEDATPAVPSAKDLISSKAYEYVLYSCTHCPKIKNYPAVEFSQHIAVHKSRPFMCSICSEFLPAGEEAKEEHWNQKHDDQDQSHLNSTFSEKFLKIDFDQTIIWMCFLCRSGFSTEAERDAHENICREQPNSQGKCVSLLQLQKSGKPWRCISCSCRFRSFSEWKIHRALYHTETDNLSCPYCDESFGELIQENVIRNNEKLQIHMRSAHKISQWPEHCEICGDVFSALYAKQDHLVKFHGIKQDKIFDCSICGAKLKSRNTLRSHMLAIHYRKDQTFVCETCGQTFKYKQTMVEHKVKKHDFVPEDYIVKTCSHEGCKFRTIIQGNLARHVKIVHEGVRQFKCKYCGKSFMDSTKRRGHEKIHENKESKPFQCDICGNSFALQNYLYIHKRLSHEKRFFPSTFKKRPRNPKKSQEKEAASPHLETSSQSNQVDCSNSDIV